MSFVMHSISVSVVEYSPATRVARVRFPADAKNFCRKKLGEIPVRLYLKSITCKYTVRVHIFAQYFKKFNLHWM